MIRENNPEIIQRLFVKKVLKLWCYRMNNYNNNITIKDQRKIGLDIIRAIAILSVVVSHSSEFLGRIVNAPYISKAAGIFTSFAQPLGVLGVELFFVLSGFLIGNILINIFLNTGFTFTDVRNFWIRRWMRTLPLYWLILTVDIYKILKFHGIVSYKFLYYFFLQNLWYPHPQFFFGEAWSLSVEEWFYITLPLVMLISGIVFHPANKRIFLLRVFISYALIFIVVRFINAFHPINGPDQDTGIRKVVIFRLDSVMYGVLFAYLNIFSAPLLARIKKLLLLVSVVGFIGLYYLIKNPATVISSTNEGVRFMSDVFLYLLIPLLLSFCLPFANGIKKINNKYISKAIVHISKISYSMYLTHYSLIFISFFFYLKVTAAPFVIALYLGYWPIVILLSSILYKYYEHPIMKLRERLSK